MGIFESVLWRKRIATRIDKGPNSLNIVGVPRYQNLPIIGKTNQATIKHPMHRPRERDAVAHDIRPIFLNRSNMSCRNLCSTIPIYQLEATDRASIRVRSQDVPTENPVPQDSRNYKAASLTTLLEHKRRLTLGQPQRRFGLAYARQQRVFFIEAECYNIIKVALRN